jgi:2-polyprenyl-6-methoxyphenol hydroxylase-like FAD-dependent oxidoreductase
MTQTHRRAIVIGGGIAGPAVSLFLQRSGIVPQIFEAYPEPATIGGGFHIAPNGMRVLANLGLAERVADAGAPSSAFCFRNHHGRVIGRIDLHRFGFGVTILRAAFQRILLEELARRGLGVAYGKRLSTIEDSGHEIVAHFDDGSTTRGEMLLAADGVGSRVRALILPDHAQPRYTGMLGIGGFAGTGSVVPTDPHDAHRLNFTVGSRLQFGYANLSATAPLWGWWCHLPQERELPRSELQAITNDELRARVLQAFRGWHPPVEAFVSATEHIMRTAIYDVPKLPTWHVGCVMLLGDAAHAMSPAGGQGASLALEDAMVAGRLVRASTPIERAFTEIESRLRPRAERVVAQAAENDVRQLKELGVVGRWMRDRLFPLFVPMVARELERQYAVLPGTSAEAA